MSDNMPLHLRVREGLMRELQGRGLGPGDRVPTETETAELFGVSRSTAREALRQLEQEGVVTVTRGLGRFLSAAGSLRLERPIDRFEGVTEMLEGLGYQVRTAVLSVEEDAADDTEARALNLAVGDPVIRLARLRYGDDRPLIYSVNTMPAGVLPGPAWHRDWSTSVTAALAAHGHLIETSVARLRAVDLPEDLAERHSLRGMGPWLLVEETCLSRGGRKVLHALDYHRGEDIAFNVVRRR